MTITIHPTSKTVDLYADPDPTSKCGSVPARLWEGTTDTGIPVHCFITRIAATVHKDDPRQKEFAVALEEQRAPETEGPAAAD